MKTEAEWRQVLTPEQFAEESDKSPGVLLASGFIAGGAIAGIIIAFLAGVLDRVDRALTAWATAHNPLYEGAYSDLLSLIPFAILCWFLYMVGREKFLNGKTAGGPHAGFEAGAGD